MVTFFLSEVRVRGGAADETVCLTGCKRTAGTFGDAAKSQCYLKDENSDSEMRLMLALNIRTVNTKYLPLTNRVSKLGKRGRPDVL